MVINDIRKGKKAASKNWMEERSREMDEGIAWTDNLKAFHLLATLTNEGQQKTSVIKSMSHPTQVMLKVIYTTPPLF